MPKSYRCTLQVRGYEIDSFGHVNHANYLNYLEHARWQMLNQEGITLERINRDQRWPVIQSAEIKYRKPVFAGDTLEVVTQATRISPVRFQFEQTIFRGESVVAEATLFSVMINEKGRPVETPEYYNLILEENPPEESHV